jgi:RNA polymerase primary sigma factor
MRQFKISEKFTPRLTRSSGDYMNEVERYPMMSPEKEAEIGYLAAAGDKEAMDKLVKANLRFVLSVAKMYSSSPEDYADLVAAGNIGLVEASGKFDPTRGFKFISFAVWHIRKEMLSHMSEAKKLVRLPMNQIGVLRAMREASNEISMREGRDATFDEAFASIKEKKDKYKTLRRDALFSATVADYRPSSFSNPISSESDSMTLLDIIESGEKSSDDSVLQNDFNRILNDLIDNLSLMEKDIVFRRHGVGEYDGDPHSFPDMGKIYSMSGENIRVKYQKAMRKLKIQAKRLSIKEHDIF